MSTDPRIIITAKKEIEDISLIRDMPVGKKVILDCITKVVEKNKEKKSGSTLTFGSLDNNGNLKFAILGDSPVYLAVKDKDIVIQISSDMDHNSDRYRHLCLEIEPNNAQYLDKNNHKYQFLLETIDKDSLNRLGGRLEPFGAIGDSDINGIIRKPEFYDFSKDTIFYNKLNDFLKTIGIETPITKLLKNGDANVVMASDGLNDRKIKDKKFVCDYKMCLTGDISKKEYDDAKDCLPVPKGIEFIAIEKDKVLDSQENPIVLIATDIKKAIIASNNLESVDDVTIFALQKGKTGLVADGHRDAKVSNDIINTAFTYITASISSSSNQAPRYPNKDKTEKDLSKKNPNTYFSH